MDDLNPENTDLMNSVSSMIESLPTEGGDRMIFVITDGINEEKSQSDDYAFKIAGEATSHCVSHHQIKEFRNNEQPLTLSMQWDEELQQNPKTNVGTAGHIDHSDHHAPILIGGGDDIVGLVVAHTLAMQGNIPVIVIDPSGVDRYGIGLYDSSEDSDNDDEPQKIGIIAHSRTPSALLHLLHALSPPITNQAVAIEPDEVDEIENDDFNMLVTCCGFGMGMNDHMKVFLNIREYLDKDLGCFILDEPEAPAYHKKHAKNHHNLRGTNYLNQQRGRAQYKNPTPKWWT